MEPEDLHDTEEIEVPYVPEPWDEDGVCDPPERKDDGHAEGVDRDGAEARQA